MRSMAELWGQRAWETGPQLATATGCLLMEERYVLHSKVLDSPIGSTLAINGCTSLKTWGCDLIETLRKEF